MIYGEETYKESGQIFGDAPEEERLRNVPASMLKTAICLSGGRGGPSASAQGFPCPRSFTDGHQVKEKGKNPLCFESYLHAELLLAKGPQLVSPSQRPQPALACAVG